MDIRLTNEAIRRAMSRPMVWGEDDCCLWACDLIRDHTGVDLAEPIRGYASRLGAAKALRRFGGGGLTEAAVRLAKEYGLEAAGRPYGGDLVAVVATSAGAGLAVWWLSGWLGRTPDGVGIVPPWQAVAAWRFPQCRS